MPNVKSITLRFENCEEMSFDRNVIGIFLIDNVSPYVARIACNSIVRGMMAKTFAIELFAEGNTDYSPWFAYEANADRHETKFKRIQGFADITSVRVMYEDGSEEEFGVDYDAGDKRDLIGADNRNQKTYMSELGNLYIVVSEEIKDIRDYFDLEVVNDAEHISFVKKMMDIGIPEEEEHPLGTGYPLPDLYRHVYLIDDDGHSNLAMRVCDRYEDWRFVLDDLSIGFGGSKAIHFPTRWQYPKANIVSLLESREGDDAFTVANVKRRYPPLDSEQEGE